MTIQLGNFVSLELHSDFPNKLYISIKMILLIMKSSQTISKGILIPNMKSILFSS
ncbi:hypothetical protein D3C74_259250 [compost metagenome]